MITIPTPKPKKRQDYVWSTGEVAEIIGCTRQTITRYAGFGYIGLRVDYSWRFSHSDIEWLNRTYKPKNGGRATLPEKMERYRRKHNIS